MIGGAAVFVIGGAAAAYFSNYLPNKPENKLISALANAASEEKATIEGTVNGQYIQDGSSNEFDASYSLVADNDNLAIRAESKIAGSNYAAEVRLIGPSLFFKITGVSASVLKELYPSANTPLWTEIFKAVEGINNQWYEFEQTPTESDINCLNSVNLKLGEKDKQIVKQAFKQNPPLVIKNTKEVTVDGQPATKFEVTTADGKKLRGFVDGVASTSFLQTINKCDTTGKSSPQAIRDEIDESTKSSSPFSIYIDKDNKLKKIEFDYKDNYGTAKLVANFKWGVGSVSKPEGAKPVQDLINDVFGASSPDENIFDESIFNDVQPDALLN